MSEPGPVQLTWILLFWKLFWDNVFCMVTGAWLKVSWMPMLLSLIVFWVIVSGLVYICPLLRFKPMLQLVMVLPVMVLLPAIECQLT